ncbi:hypothetical protein O3M35_012834 [Rhynocoris fuscipes]|uniref:Peptidase S1 domain-containing protein n=1 Tax=Rhynocoris fuscipes TaxID=488301 RepID=A0AAW1CI15_9HEMI
MKNFSKILFSCGLVWYIIFVNIKSSEARKRRKTTTFDPDQVYHDQKDFFHGDLYKPHYTKKNPCAPIVLPSCLPPGRGKRIRRIYPKSFYPNNDYDDYYYSSDYEEPLDGDVVPYLGWMAHDGYESTCSATLLYPSWAITTATCIIDWNEDNTTIKFGEVHHFINHSSHVEQSRKVVKFFRMPYHDGTYHDEKNDVALVYFQEPVKYGMHIYPIKLAQKHMWNKEDRLDCKVAGHDMYNVSIIYNATAVRGYGENYCNCLDEERNICVTEKIVNKKCIQDTGGPLVCKVNRKHYLIGVRHGLFRQELCDSRSRGIRVFNKQIPAKRSLNIANSRKKSIAELNNDDIPINKDDVSDETFNVEKEEEKSSEENLVPGEEESINNLDYPVMETVKDDEEDEEENSFIPVEVEVVFQKTESPDDSFKTGKLSTKRRKVKTTEMSIAEGTEVPADNFLTGKLSTEATGGQITEGGFGTATREGTTKNGIGCMKKKKCVLDDTLIVYTYLNSVSNWIDDTLKTYPQDPVEYLDEGELRSRGNSSAVGEYEYDDIPTVNKTGDIDPGEDDGDADASSVSTDADDVSADASSESTDVGSESTDAGDGSTVAADGGADASSESTDAGDGSTVESSESADASSGNASTSSESKDKGSKSNNNNKGSKKSGKKVKYAHVTEPPIEYIDALHLYTMEEYGSAKVCHSSEKLIFFFFIINAILNHI